MQDMHQSAAPYGRYELRLKARSSKRGCQAHCTEQPRFAIGKGKPLFHPSVLLPPSANDVGRHCVELWLFAFRQCLAAEGSREHVLQSVASLALVSSKVYLDFRRL